MPPTKREFTAAFLRNGLSLALRKQKRNAGFSTNAIGDYYQDSSCATNSVGSNVVIPFHDKVIESVVSNNNQHVKEDESRVVSEKNKKEDVSLWDKYCSLAPVFAAMDESLYFDIEWQKTHPY